MSRNMSVQMGDRIKSKIDEQRKREERHRKCDSLAQRHSAQSPRCISGKTQGSGEHLPGIPSPKPSEKNAECAEGEHADGEIPGMPATEPTAHYLLHQVKREITKKETSPCERHENDEIKPRRHRSAALQMHKISDQVRRVGIEKKPKDRATCQQRPTPRLPGAEAVDDQGKDQRNPRKQQVAGEKGEPYVARVDGAADEHGHASCGGENQSKQCEASPPAMDQSLFHRSHD